jgi:hypothetical protein
MQNRHGWSAKAIALAALVALGSACNDVSVHGRVVRITPAMSYDGPVVFGPSSAARVALYSNPRLGGDGPSTLLDEQVFSPAPELPFEFGLGGPRHQESGSEHYYVTVDIRQHPGEYTIGDLLSETINEVHAPEDEIIVEVQGLESCTAPNVGGGCAAAPLGSFSAARASCAEATRPVRSRAPRDGRTAP